MNKTWSNLNKIVQVQLKKEQTFSDGINTLLSLRQNLMDALLLLKRELRREDFNAMPYPNAKGYHSKTIAYSIWHIFRIEDIVAHSLIQNDCEILKKYRDKIGTTIITTGNELQGEDIKKFSEDLNLDALYVYAVAVKDGTDELLKKLSFYDLKRKFGNEDRERLKKLQVVSTDQSACWLIDYWCGKDVKGLIHMPFSRHWIMHEEACLRIRNKL
jgi:hypothetical protein